MTVIEVVSEGSRLLLALVAGLTLLDLIRHRDRTRLEIALMMAGLGIPVIGREIRGLPFALGAAEQWIRLGSAIMLIAQPYLAMRLVALFRPVRPVYLWAVALAMVAGWVAVAVNNPVSRPVAMGIIAYFIAASSYATWAFVQGMRQSRGAFRSRLGFAGLGSGLLAVVFVFLAVAPAIPGIAEVVVAVLPTFIAGAFYLAFLPPRWVRQAWQLPEVHRFLEVLGSAGPQARSQTAGHELCRATSKLTGGVASAVVQWDDVRGLFRVENADSPALADQEFPADGGVIGRTWRRRTPAITTRQAELAPGELRIADELGAHTVLSAPIVGSERTWGILLAFRPQRQLFSPDLVELMGLLAAQYAVVLENAELLQEQERLVTHLRRANEEMESFSYSISHDLRRPLRGIDGFSNVLIRNYADRLDAQGVDYLTRVRAAAQSMGRQIDDLLGLCRLSKEEIRIERLNLSTLAWTIADELRDRHPERDVEFTIPDHLVALGDRGLIRLVLENLLDNAWKFTAFRPKAAIELGSIQPDGERVYYVRDDGAGFDPAYTERLFQPFQRLHAATEFPGTGIGLASVQWIIRRHGGRVWAEGAPNKGATFFFTLPAKGFDYAEPPILLVEDSPDDEALTILAMQMNNIVNEVIVARDGAEALEYLLGDGQPLDGDRELPRVVLLDLKLPKIDGHEVLRRVREDPRTRLLPVVILTTSSEQEDRVRAYSTGANSFVRKPVDFDRFTNAVGQLGSYWLVLNEPAYS